MQFESKKLRTAALVTLGTLLATGARADGFELVKYEDVAKSGLIEANIAVPESPAFTALGLNPEDVTRPGTPRRRPDARGTPTAPRPLLRPHRRTA